MSNALDSNSAPIKPTVTPEMVRILLKGYFDRPIRNLQVVPGGHVAQTFSFTVGASPGWAAEDDQAYIIRFNAPMLVNFEKEAHVYAHFAAPGIPIPCVVQHGRLGGVYFAITEKVPGQTLLQIPRAAYLGLIPAQMELLDAIHRVPLGNRPGYGIFDGQGAAPAPSWPAHLQAVSAEEPVGDFYGSWHGLFQSSLLERPVFEDIYRRMEQLINYCPAERYLVHGDYGFGNVLVQDGRITGVLDWMAARYGDFLYDVAWLDFWSPADNWQARFAQHYRQAGTAVPFYGERVVCYQCYIALDALKFYAKGGDPGGYGYVRERIRTLLSAG